MTVAPVWAVVAYVGEGNIYPGQRWWRQFEDVLYMVGLNKYVNM